MFSIKKCVTPVIALLLISIYVPQVTFAESSREKSLVLDCKGAFWMAYGGTFGGGESVGKSTVRVFRNTVDAYTWYSAEVSAEGDPNNQGIVVRDYEFLSVTRSFFPGAASPGDISTSFSWESGPGEVRLGKFEVGIVKERIGSGRSFTSFSYPDTAEHGFNPTVKCQWAPGEGHTIFYP